MPSDRAKPIIEVDGPSHDLTFADDEQRTERLERQGCRVVRPTNHAVATTVDLVLTLTGLIDTGG